MEITDFGIAKIGDEDDIKAGTSGWAEGSQFADGDINSDNFAARLVVFMILLVKYSLGPIQSEVVKLKSIFSRVDFNFATILNRSKPRDWLLYDTGFVLKISQKSKSELLCEKRVTLRKKQLPSDIVHKSVACQTLQTLKSPCPNHSITYHIYVIIRL